MNEVTNSVESCCELLFHNLFFTETSYLTLKKQICILLELTFFYKSNLFKGQYDRFSEKSGTNQICLRVNVTDFQKKVVLT